MSIYLLATLDTKGSEAAVIRDRLRELGFDVTVVDVGAIGTPSIPADITREQVFADASSSLAAIAREQDRGEAITQSAQGAAGIVSTAFQSGDLQGVVAIGGSAGTTIGTTAMQSLPIGVPKVMLSTLASGQVRPYVADKDIAMLNTIVDLAGVNRISRDVLLGAAHAVAGMVAHRREIQHDDKPIIAATMFGVTTPCVQTARQLLEERGYEVLVFHATGNGGQAMESLIRDGAVAGVLDITTTELADELVGGILTAGATRLTAASEMGIPQLISVGATDMVNFGPPESVPDEFVTRQFYQHNPTVTLMRTTADECAAIGRDIGTKVARSRGPVEVLLPTQGVSAIDKKGEAFHDADARHALFLAIEASCGEVPVDHVRCHINEEAFATACVERLLLLMAANS